MMTKLGSTVFEFNLTEHSFRELPLESLQIDLAEKNKVYWVHCDLSQPDILKKIAEKLPLPEHVLEWCAQEEKVPQLRDDEESLTIQVGCLLSDEVRQGQEIEFEDLLIYLTPKICFTAATASIPALLSFLKNYSKALRYAKTSCFMLFLILDDIINDYSKTLLDFQSLSDNIDIKVREMSDNMYGEVITVKKQLMKSKRYISTIRDSLMRISARKIPVISKECRLSLRNLYNHSQMIGVQMDSVRDSLNSTLGQIDNALMQKMNSTMKVLTAFAAIFLPLSLIAGIYGMNFKIIPELHWQYGYFWALGLMVLCTSILIFIFKKKRWF